MRDMLLVLNFYDEASRALTRKLRSEKVMCRIVPGDASLEEIQAQEPLGLVLAGGVGAGMPSGLDKRLCSADLPILALGDAAGLLLTILGGYVGETALQDAVSPVRYQESPLFDGVEEDERLLQGVRAWTLPDSVQPLCFAKEITLGFAHRERPLYGIQFQVEPNDPEGGMILRNFAQHICGCTAWWDEDAFVAKTVEEIRRATGEGKAACAMTGGLDSGVSAMLAFKALGSRLKCVFVDTGLLRENEAEDFLAYYRDTVGMDITRVSAQERFLKALQGVKSLPEKRAVLSRLIRAILREQEAGIGPIDVLIRGTSCSDVLRGVKPLEPSLGENATVIEPVRDLFKEEIRRVGTCLGIPAEIISRQPFPGGGLALRIMGEVTRERLETLRAADAIFRAEVELSNAGKRLWQYFAVLLPMPEDETKSVICLRAVHASERSQTYAARLPYDVMEAVVEKILREQKDVRRVVYDLTPSGNYAEVEWQ